MEAPPTLSQPLHGFLSAGRSTGSATLSIVWCLPALPASLPVISSEPYSPATSNHLLRHTTFPHPPPLPSHRVCLGNPGAAPGSWSPPFVPSPAFLHQLVLPHSSMTVLMLCCHLQNCGH